MCPKGEMIIQRIKPLLAILIDCFVSKYPLQRINPLLTMIISSHRWLYTKHIENMYFALYCISASILRLRHGKFAANDRRDKRLENTTREFTNRSSKRYIYFFDKEQSVFP